jgi:phosphate transport system protein
MSHFGDKLESLKRQVAEMGEAVESMVAWAAAALADRHPESFRKVVGTEPRIDQFQIEIDREVIRLMTIYSPIAKDLRFLLMVARINSELERIGDQALNNCEYVEQLPASPRPAALADLSRMSEIARGMVHDALRAFNTEDTDRARGVVRLDDEVDALYIQTFRDLLKEGGANQDILNESMTMILLARSVERIADHATNICEEVIYAVQGEDIRHQKDA